MIIITLYDFIILNISLYINLMTNNWKIIIMIKNSLI